MVPLPIISTLVTCLLLILPPSTPFQIACPHKRHDIRPTTRIMSLRLAADPMMDSGKALARAGELLIEWTSSQDLYGGALSAAGAQIRNAGDSVAQAAASCRFKTAAELVIDELRESGTCLVDAADKMLLAIQEAEQDNMIDLARNIAAIEPAMRACGASLEAAGAGIMQKAPLGQIGASLTSAGDNMKFLAESSFGEHFQRMSYASEKMMEAGNNLQGIATPRKTGKGWLKG